VGREDRAMQGQTALRQGILEEEVATLV
jgi:hypothetical protein